MVTFINSFEYQFPEARPPLVTAVVAESSFWEDDNLAIFEWVKFFALFFNQETTANLVFQAAQDRYNCVADNAALLVDTDQKTNVLWGELRK